jgi:uncharacterized protein YdhG (YjbR/CyaY superfamily)
MTRTRPDNIDEYINNAPVYAREKLHELRNILREVAPGAQEQIRWGNPVFIEKRILFSFSAHKFHINFMPTSQSLIPFTEELKNHKTGKDTLQIPYDKPLPKEIIRKIATHRARDVKENDAKWMS